MSIDSGCRACGVGVGLSPDRVIDGPWIFPAFFATTCLHLAALTPQHGENLGHILDMNVLII